MKKEKIKEVLERNTELSEEEYAKVFEKADKCATGNTGKSRQDNKKPISEEIKHKRIQSNFYGSSINCQAAIYDELCRLNDMMAVALGYVKPEEKEEK